MIRWLTFILVQAGHTHRRASVALKVSHIIAGEIGAVTSQCLINKGCLLIELASD